MSSSSPSIKVVSFGNLSPSESGRTQTGLALCPGTSFVTRLDYETNVFKDFGGPFLNGVRVYCSGNAAPPFSIHYLITSANSAVSTLAQVEGTVAPEGIRETFVYADQYVNMFGYPGSFAGQSTGTAWQQARSEVTGCLLKGVELNFVEWVDGMRLHFDCSSPTPPAPSPQPIPPPAPVTVTVVLPPPTPITSTLVVGSGAAASTIVTVVMLTPTPVTITLPASNPQAIITAPATTVLATDAAAGAAAAHHQQSSWRSSLLMGLLAGLAIVLAGVVLALLVLFVRQRRKQRRPRDRGAAQQHELEKANVGAVPAEVDPPAYLAVAIPRVDAVDVSLEPASLEGKQAGGAPVDGKGGKFEEIELDECGAGEGPRRP